MNFTAEEIARMLKGELQGKGEIAINKLSKIEEAKSGSLSFLANPKYESLIYTTKASAILVNRSFVPKKEIESTLIRVDDVYASLTILMNSYDKRSFSIEEGVSSLAFINQEAKLEADISVGPFAFIGACRIKKNVKIASHVFIDENCVIGNNVIIYPGVKIYSDTIIGDNVIIHANAVIGSDGFGFSKDAMGNYIKMSQLGNVVIEDDVEIGSNTVIDRASLGSTFIRKGVKLDNLIQIAHNVEVDENTVIAAQSGIAGSTKLGKNCMVGGQVGFVGHLKIADGAQFQAQSGVAGSIRKENAKMYGYPAIDYNTYLRAFANFKQLPDMAKKLRDLEKELQELRSKQE